MKKYLLLILFTVSCFISCNNTKDANNKNNSADTVTITDALGREVTLKKDIKKIISIDRGFIPQTLKDSYLKL